MLREVHELPTSYHSRNFEDEAVFEVDHEAVPSLSRLWELNVVLHTTPRAYSYDDDDDEYSIVVMSQKWMHRVHVKVPTYRF